MIGGSTTDSSSRKSSSRLSLGYLKLTQMMTGSGTRLSGGIREQFLLLPIFINVLFVSVKFSQRNQGSHQLPLGLHRQMIYLQFLPSGVLVKLGKQTPQGVALVLATDSLRTTPHRHPAVDAHPVQFLMVQYLLDRLHPRFLLM